MPDQDNKEQSVQPEQSAAANEGDSKGVARVQGSQEVPVDQSRQEGAPSHRGSFGQVRERERKRREIIRAEARDVKLSSRLGDMIVPFVSVGVLILLIVFVFLPFGTQIVETRESTQGLLDEIERNEKKVEQLSSIDLNQLEERLRKIRLVVRDEMDVAELAIEVEEMAVGRDVDPTSAELSNSEDLVQAASQVEVEWVPEYADTISGPFAYEGKFEALTDFLHALRLDSRTVLSMGEINMSYRLVEDETTGKWVAGLVITGYTTEPAHETTISAPVITEIDQEYLDEIFTRAEKYEGTEDNSESEGSGEESVGSEE